MVSRFVDLCEQWRQRAAQGNFDIAGFARVIAEIDQLPHDKRKLADRLGVAEAALSRWAKGISKPEPEMQEYVVGELHKLALRASRWERARRTLSQVMRHLRRPGGGPRTGAGMTPAG